MDEKKILDMIKKSGENVVQILQSCTLMLTEKGFCTIMSYIKM